MSTGVLFYTGISIIHLSSICTFKPDDILSECLSELLATYYYLLQVLPHATSFWFRHWDDHNKITLISMFFTSLCVHIYFLYMRKLEVYLYRNTHRHRHIHVYRYFVFIVWGLHWFVQQIIWSMIGSDNRPVYTCYYVDGPCRIFNKFTDWQARCKLK